MPKASEEAEPEPEHVDTQMKPSTMEVLMEWEGERDALPCPWRSHMHPRRPHRSPCEERL